MTFPDAPGVHRLTQDEIETVINRIEEAPLNERERTTAANLLRNYIRGLESRVDGLQQRLELEMDLER